MTWWGISGALSPVPGFCPQLVVVVGALSAPTFAQPGHCVDVGSCVLPELPPLDRSSSSKQQHFLSRGRMCVRQCATLAWRLRWPTALRSIALKCSPIITMSPITAAAAVSVCTSCHAPFAAASSSTSCLWDPCASSNSSQVAQVVPRSWYLASSLWVTQTLSPSPPCLATGVGASFDYSQPGVMSVALRPWILASTLRVTLASTG